MNKNIIPEILGAETGTATAESTELITIVRFPAFEQSFVTANSAIQKRLSALDGLDVTEDTKTAVKKIKADLNKEFEAFEERRKFVKKEISKPYEELEKLYKTYIADPYKSAISELGDKITFIERRQINEKHKEALEYFKEYRESVGGDLDFLNFDRLDLSVNLSVSMTKIKEQIGEKCDKIKADIDGLKTMGELSDRYIICYRNVLDVSRAISTVNKDVGQEKILNEVKKAEAVPAPAAELDEPAPEVTPAVEVAAPVIKELSFKAWVTRELLEKLQLFMRNEGIKYERIK